MQEASKSGSTRRKQEGSYGASFVFFALRREARCSVKGSCAGWRAKGRSVTNRGEFVGPVVQEALREERWMVEEEYRGRGCGSRQ